LRTFQFGDDRAPFDRAADIDIKLGDTARDAGADIDAVA
jgi:hypothetical protein